MWNKSIKLVTETQKNKDKDGYTTKQESYLEGIPAKFLDTTRNDEIVANQIGYNADLKIEIMACNYNGERILYDEETGNRYEVKRSYKPENTGKVQLICERRD